MRKTVKSMLTFLLVIAMLVTVVGCGSGDTGSASSTASAAASSTAGESEAAESTASGDDVYRFALIAPLTGNNAQYGLAYQRAVELLVEQVNAEGGINGGEVVVDIYDDKNDATEAVTVANSVAEQDDILGVIGSQTSTPSMAMAPAQAPARAVPCKSVPSK